MNKKKLLVAIGIVGCLILIAVVALPLFLRSRNVNTDEYLAYEKLTDGPEISFSSAYSIGSDRDYDAYYTKKNQPNLYYRFLEDADPRDMVILNEMTHSFFDAEGEGYLLYHPQRVTDPWASLTPCKAVLSVTDVDGQLYAEFEDPSVWDGLWNAVLASETVSQDTFRDTFDMKNAFVFKLYLDSGEKIYLSFQIRVKTDGSYWYTIASEDSSDAEKRFYTVPCEGIILDTVQSYLSLGEVMILSSCPYYGGE